MIEAHEKQSLRTDRTAFVQFTILLRYNCVRSLITELSSKGLETLRRSWVYATQTL